MMGQLKSLFWNGVFPAFCMVGIAYNTLVMLNADEGIRMNDMLQDRIAEEQQHIVSLQSQYTQLSDTADRLMSASLDEDLLEERVRSVLGLVRPGEYKVRMEDLDKLAAFMPDRSEPTETITLADLGGDMIAAYE